MSIRSQITDQMKTAMKNHDALSLDALRYLLSSVKNQDIDAHRELTDEEIVSVIQKEVKRRNEAIDQFSTAGRTELVEQEKVKLQVFMQFMPKQLSEDEVRVEVQSIAQQLETKDMSTLMKAAMSQLKGKADGKTIASVVKEIAE